MADGVQALQIWARLKNARGGLNGHPIQLFVADDGGDPARHKALLKDMVETKRVIAFVHNADVVTGASSVEYINSKRVPVIGSDTGGIHFYTSPMYFPQASTGDDLNHVFFGVAAEQALPRGQDKVAVITCVEPIPSCESYYRMATGPAPASYGLKVVYAGRASIAAPDYTAECLNAKGAGAQLLIPGIDSNSIARIAASCARQNFFPRFVIGTTLVRPAFVESKSFDDAIIGVFTFPWIARDTPERKEFADAMQQYAPGTVLNPAHSAGWVSAKLFERAVSRLVDRPSSAGILDGLWSISNDDLGGLTLPLTFVREQPAKPRACWFTLGISDGRFQTKNDGRLACSSHYP